MYDYFPLYFLLYFLLFGSDIQDTFFTFVLFRFVLTGRSSYATYFFQRRVHSVDRTRTMIPYIRMLITRDSFQIGLALFLFVRI